MKGISVPWAFHWPRLVGIWPGATKGIRVSLEGEEEAVLFWKEGKAYTEGYDLESEKAVLALTDFGTGVGVLLVAINDCCKNEKEFEREIKKFVAGYKKLLANKYDYWPQGQLLFEYCSYSSDPNIRWKGMPSAHLSERHYKRILKEPEVDFKIWMAILKELPEKYFHALANLSDSEINYVLAQNEKCPIDVLEILAKNKDLRIRKFVVRNPTCPERLLEILAQDQDNNVGLVAQNKLAIIKRRGLEV